VDAGLYAEPSTRRTRTSGVATAGGAVLRSDQVYAELRGRLMAGEFGLQERLVEERLAALVGVSRTPIREAMVRLRADGLVVRSGSGYYPALPDLTQLRDLYELRMTLELRGVSRAMDNDAMGHDREVLEELRDLWHAMRDDRPEPTPEFVLVDEDFHVTLLAAAGNGVLTEMLRTVNARIRAVRMYDFITEDRIERTIEEHLGIVENVLAGDLSEALAVLRRHIVISMEVVEGRAATAITQMALGRGQQ
jgi:DNA-binding GntR family transcriptional regulator